MKDIEIRPVLRNAIQNAHHNDATTIIVEELDLAASGARVDIAVVNGHLHAYEIKSACDNLKRLPKQVTAYTKIFDLLTIVTESKYIDSVIRLTPNWVEVLEITQESNLVKKRTGTLNNGQDGFSLSQLLWREEMERLLRSNHIAFNRRLTKWKLSELISQTLPIEIIKKEVREIIKSRENWRSSNCDE